MFSTRIKRIRSPFKGFKDGNATVEDQKNFHRVNQHCDMTNIPQTIEREEGQGLGNLEIKVKWTQFPRPFWIRNCEGTTSVCN